MPTSSPPTTTNGRTPLSSSMNVGECSSSAPSNTPCSKPPPSLARQASSIARQASIYSLNLDEFQNTLGEPSKPFGSMNIDDFLKNIWTAEESQAMAVAIGSGADEVPAPNWQHGAHRQGSLARSFSRKIAEDLWKDTAGAGGFSMGLCPESTSGAGIGQERQGTFSEMTLEDFLLRVGVVMKDNPDHSMPSVALFESSFDNGGDGIGDRSGHSSPFFGNKDVEDEKPNIKALPMLSLSAAKLPPPIQPSEGPDPMQMDARKHMSPHPRSLDWLTNHPFQNATIASHQLHGNVPQHMMESNSSAKANGAMMGMGDNSHMVPDLGVDYAAAGLPSGVFSPLTIKAGSPTSPLSDGVGPSHGSMSSISPLSYNLDGHTRGRKRGCDGSLEKVVERRQRRMIKNRESAARSRARKQAYTVELEAEVLQLKEENMRLCLLQEEMADMQKKQFLDVLATLASQYMAPKKRTLRRTRTGPW